MYTLLQCTDDSFGQQKSSLKDFNRDYEVLEYWLATIPDSKFHTIGVSITEKLKNLKALRVSDTDEEMRIKLIAEYTCLEQRFKYAYKIIQSHLHNQQN